MVVLWCFGCGSLHCFKQYFIFVKYHAYEPSIELIKIQLMLTILIAPFLCCSLKGVSLISVFYNLLLLPWVSLVTIPLLFLAMFLSLISESVSGVASLIALDNSLVRQLWMLVDLSLEPLVFSLPFSERFWIKLIIRRLHYQYS